MVDTLINLHAIISFFISPYFKNTVLLLTNNISLQTTLLIQLICPVSLSILLHIAWSKGELEINLLPQGTLAEAIRCGGAGIGGFYTRTCVGTELNEGKEEREIDGERYIFEKAIKGDLAILKAAKADKMGNLIYHATARNFNPMMATAAKIVIAEVDEIVEVGDLDPEYIVTPHAYVVYVIKSKYLKVGGEYVESR